MPSSARTDGLYLCQEPVASSEAKGEDLIWEAIGRLEKDMEALRDFLLSVVTAATTAADALATPED